MKTITRFSIQGIECPNCIMLLEGLEDRLDGVLRVEGNYRRAELSIEYDDEKISLAQLSAAIVQLGYTSKIL